MLLYLKSKKNTYDAVCDYDGKKYILKKGALIRKTNEDAKVTKKVLVLRNDKSIVDEKNILKKDIEFKSSTTAAQFVLCQSVNGNKVWKNEEGIKLSDTIKK